MRKSGRRRGSAFVEFALASTVLIAVFTGTFQFGYTFYVYNSLITAVSAGARYASVQQISNSGGTDTSVPSSFTTAIKNLTVYGSPSPANGASAIAPGLTTANVDVQVQFTSGVPSQVTVSVINYSVDAVFRSFTFNNKPSSTLPYLGSYCSTGSTCP